jgi:hypothetical protein
VGGTKPVKFGVKVWVCACGDTAACLNFEIYTGKEDFVETDPTLGSLGNMVLRVVPSYVDNCGHSICFDNYYTYFPIFVALWKRGIGAIGTYVQRGRSSEKNRDRDHWPFTKLSKAEGKKLGKGFIRTAIQDPREGSPTIVATNWNDNKPVNFLATVNVAPSHLNDVTLRRETKEMMDARVDNNMDENGSRKRIEVTSHRNVNEYNAHMGGVDRFDQLAGLIKFGIKSNRWYMRVVFWLINAVFTQMYIYCTTIRESRKGASNRWWAPFNELPKRSRHHLFLNKLANELVDVAANMGYGRKTPSNHTGSALVTPVRPTRAKITEFYRHKLFTPPRSGKSRGKRGRCQSCREKGIDRDKVKQVTQLCMCDRCRGWVCKECFSSGSRMINSGVK